MKILSILLFCSILNGCGTQVALRGQDREDYLKSIKSYGEYWIKPGATKENWRQDWVVCGGMPNGSYATDAPDGSSTATLLTASKRMSDLLAACMKSKGYKYHYVSP